MFDASESNEQEHWVIWNGFFGLLDTVTIGEVQVTASGREAWLEEPYDMVGPFSLDELELNGSIHFAECQVMSRQKWQNDQVELRREGHKARRAAEERLYAERERAGKNRNQAVNQFEQYSERQHREQLNLPKNGELKVAEIKSAYRKLAQKAHPDQGGSQEQFVRITQARDALLARAS
ncbi:DnaJ-like protein [Alteromonadaceae bacterium 2753L.S.0a.02]|nr:DnaJ-like protein [Alteromonadaceae bacterium 2753L.S.0a.02]